MTQQEIPDKDLIVERLSIMTENGLSDEEALHYLLQVFPEHETEIRAIIAELPPKKTKINKRQLIDYITCKIPLVPSIYEDGKTRPICSLYDDAKKPIEENFVKTTEFFEELIAGRGKLTSKRRTTWTNSTPITIFQFYPKLGDLVILDLDSPKKITGEQHGQGVDGISAFKDLISRKKSKLTEKQRKMFEDFPENFPCYVKTPSGGLHLYFRYFSATRLKKSLEGTNIECKHRSLVTAAGSIRGNRHYQIFGKLTNIPNFPDAIWEEFYISDEKENRIKTPDEIFESAVRTAQLKGYAGNNDLIFYVAGRFAYFYRNSGYPRELDEEHCRRYIQSLSFYYDWNDKNKGSQLDTIIDNAYRG